MTDTANALYARYLDACRRNDLKPKAQSSFANKQALVLAINTSDHHDHEQVETVMFGFITVKLNKVQRAKLRKALARRLDIQRFNTRWDHVVPVTVLQACNIPYRPA